jgi:hypothetical protein
MKAGFVLILCGILPTVIAYYADTTKHRYGVATVTCCNLSGVLPYVVELHYYGNNWAQLSSYLSDATVWLWMYGMAALGYLLVTGCPMAYRYGLQIINTSFAFQIQQKQDALVKEWGEDIRTETELAMMGGSSKKR